jgi:RecA-family ATPase
LAWVAQHSQTAEVGSNATGKQPSFAEPIVASQLPTGGATAAYLWDGYIVLESVTLLTSLWKAGKTTLLALLLKAMSDGSLLAGRSVTAGRVFVVTEESARLWAGRRDKLKIGDHVFFDIRPFRTRPGFLDWLQYIKHLTDVVHRYGLSLVCLDTLSSLSPCDDENAAAKMMAALTPLHAITEAGAGVVMLHHPRKGDGTEGRTSRGSGALPGFADVIVEMRRPRTGSRGRGR